MSNNRDYLLYSSTVGRLETNCYMFGSLRTRQVAIIDPGADYEKIKAVLAKNKLIALFIINTHGHIDHISANCKFDLPVYIHREDADFLTDPGKSLSAFYGSPAVSPYPARLLAGGDEIEIADIRLEVLHTPGHTPGGISLHYDGIVFTGDTLFDGAIGRTDLPYGNHEKLMSSIKDKLLKLNDDVIVLPGHGAKTTIGKQRNFF